MTPANFKDMTGLRCAKLVVIDRATGTRLGTSWNCVCDCGQTCVVPGVQLRNGSTRSCGCLRRAGIAAYHERSGHKKWPADPVGERHVALTIVERLGRKNGNWEVRAVCDCGNEKIALLGNIRSGMTAYCSDCARCAMDAYRVTHSLSGTKIYSTWFGMKSRCEPETGDENYGKRGIFVCAGWLESVEAFAADMGEPPTPSHSIDRINNNRGYDCGKCADCVYRDATANCRWATQREQMRNTRRSVYLEWEGQRWLISDLCKARGVSRQLMNMRVKHGWDLTLAATTRPGKSFGGFRSMTPERRREVAAAGQAASSTVVRVSITSHVPHARRTRPPRMITALGLTRSLREWAVIAGVSPGTITQRLARGVHADVAVATDRTNGRVVRATLPRGMSLREAIAERGGSRYSLTTIKKRIERGATFEQAMAASDGRGRPRKRLVLQLAPTGT